MEIQRVFRPPVQPFVKFDIFESFWGGTRDSTGSLPGALVIENQKHEMNLKK
jgi:hypothetical protein